MKSTSFYLGYLVKKLWTLAAILLVVMAVSISVLRFSLPYMDGQKARVESWLSEQYGVQLNIGELNASWSKSGPSLVLKDIYLQQDEKSPIGLEISSTQIEIDFWGSITAGQIQSKRFELNGMALSVNLTRIQTAETEFPIVAALENLFLEQLHRFSIRNSIVDVNTRYDQQLIQIQQLSWVNKEQRHQGVGLLRVVELANNSATFTLDLTGDKDNLRGVFYAKGEELDLSPWLNQLVRTQNQLTQSRGNFTFWASIENSRVDNVQVQLDKSEFVWKTPDTEVQAAIVGGNISALPDDLGWTFSVEDLTFESQQKSLVTNWSGHVGRDGNTRFSNVNGIDAQSILPILPLFFDKTALDVIEQLEPEARLDDIAVLLGDDFLASIEFSQLGWKQVDDIPGLSDLSGQLFMDNEIARFSVQGVAGEIQADNLISENIIYQQLLLNGYIDWHDRGFRIEVPEFSLESDQITTQQRFVYDSQGDTLALSGTISELRLTQVKQLFPASLMGQDTSDYLRKAMVDGQLMGAQILWQGALSSFPFNDQQGTFQAAVQLRDTTFKFDPQWPALTDLDMDLLFENEGLFMQANSGSLMQVQLTDLTASIPSLTSGAVLSIDAKANAEGKQVTELMMASNLSDSVGTALTDGINLSGKAITQLQLTIPLSGDDVVAKGTVSLDGNPVYVPSLGLQLNQVVGDVSFVNDKVSVTDLDATLFGQPIAVTFDGKNDSQQAYVADIGVTGDWQLKPLLEQFQPALIQYLSGQATWHADTQITLNAQSYSYQFELTSDLFSVDSGLPVPFSKQGPTKVPLTIIGKGEDQASTFNLSLGKNITFEGVLPHETMQFSRAHLAIGENETVGMGLGFSIFADVEEADFDAWFDAISVIIDDLPSSENPILSEPQRVYVNADSMLVAGQKIQNLELVAKHSTEDWLLEFNAEQIRAKVTFYQDWLNKGIDIKADFIDLVQWQEVIEDDAKPMMKNLPPVNFECKSCRVLGKDLGRVDFSLSRAPTGMQIDSLRLNNSNGILYASGDWFLTERGSYTQLSGKLSSPDFGALLKGLGLDSGIKDSKANFDFDLSWQNAPHKFSLDSLNGEVTWGLSDGYLSEVSDKGARIFSILSLQSLVRKLSLDFRDVFSKGFFYDKMRGSFQLVDGRADTRDTVIDGAAGEMLIKGYSDLATKELNYLIEFTPNVTSSLPLLVYWMVNPATAIAALAIDQVLTEAKVISNVKYSVTGTLDEPVLTELDRKSKDVVIPARTTNDQRQDDTSAVLQVIPGERVDIEVSNPGGK